MADSRRIRPNQHIECRIEGVGDVLLSARLKEVKPDQLKISSADSIPEHGMLKLIFENSRFQLNARVTGEVTKARNNPTVGKCYATVRVSDNSREQAMELFLQVEALGQREEQMLADKKYEEARRHELNGDWGEAHKALKAALTLNAAHQEARALFHTVDSQVKKQRLKTYGAAGLALAVVLLVLGLLYVKRSYHRSEFTKLLAQAREAYEANDHAKAYDFLDAAFYHQPGRKEAAELSAILVPKSLSDVFGGVRDNKDVYQNRANQGIHRPTGLPMEIFHKPTKSYFVLVPAGIFEMGSPEKDETRKKDEVVHTVTITRPFYLGKYEVTRDAFRKFIEGTKYKTDAELKGGGLIRGPVEFEQKEHARWDNPYFPQTKQHPVVMVSWRDAESFLEWMGQGTKRLRLPTEAEWEYACRAGTIRRFYWGRLEKFAATNANVSDQKAQREFPSWPPSHGNDDHVYTAPPGGFVGNEFNLFHMSGNVAEWCSDWYDKYSTTSQTDPRGPPSGTRRVVRGGHFASSVYDARSASRAAEVPEYRSNVVGFRAVVDVLDSDIREPASAE